MLIKSNFTLIFYHGEYSWSGAWSSREEHSFPNHQASLQWS